MTMRMIILMLALLSARLASAQLEIEVSAVAPTGRKALVKLAMINNLPERIESARAICFLLDEHGKMVGQSTQWVIGGTKERPPLEPEGTNTFNFILGLKSKASTNLTANVMFTRIVLEGGKLADPKKDVIVREAGSNKKPEQRNRVQ